MAGDDPKKCRNVVRRRAWREPSPAPRPPPTSAWSPPSPSRSALRFEAWRGRGRDEGRRHGVREADGRRRITRALSADTRALRVMVRQSMFRRNTPATGPSPGSSTTPTATATGGSPPNSTSTRPMRPAGSHSSRPVFGRTDPGHRGPCPKAPHDRHQAHVRRSRGGGDVAGRRGTRAGPRARCHGVRHVTPTGGTPPAPSRAHARMLLAVAAAGAAVLAAPAAAPLKAAAVSSRGSRWRRAGGRGGRRRPDPPYHLKCRSRRAPEALSPAVSPWTTST